MAYVERGKVWAVLASVRPLKGRASPTGNRACLQRTSSPDLTGSVIGAVVGNDHGELGIFDCDC